MKNDIPENFEIDGQRTLELEDDDQSITIGGVTYSVERPVWNLLFDVSHERDSLKKTNRMLVKVSLVMLTLQSLAILYLTV